MRFRNLTRHREIGANSYLLESGNQRVVLDAGMHPKHTGQEALPDFGPLPTHHAQALLVTHAHHDHIGALPVLQRRQPQAAVLMTEPTGEVGSAMLHNSVNVMSRQREELGVTEYPMFTHRELDDIRPQWIYRDYERPFTVPDTDLEASFHDAGHILGSSGIQLREGGARLFYTGDVCFENQTLMQAARFPEQDIDVLLLETTRGTYARPEDYSRKAEKERLARLIQDTWEANGSVLIPVFALGKTQELLLMMHELSQEGLMPSMPVFIGGLGTKITVLYDHYADRVPRNYPGFRLLEDIDILVAPRARRREIQYQSRAIYLLSSGMMTEKTTSNTFAWKFIDNPRNAVAFVGYTDPETPGYRLRTAAEGSEIRLSPDLSPVKLAARVESFDFSAHATREQLADYAERVRPQKLVLVHGEVESQAWFAQRFQETLPETEIILPEPHRVIDLW
ncbi:MAG: MBL fold metallo-hydrolase [Verrucomicrobiales bacterium]|nr:MBL fold metallo-hydrolase [Verrucomicrobiales bacterium]